MAEPPPAAVVTQPAACTDVDSELAALADAHGVATAYDDWAHRPVTVSRRTVVSVLGVMGVDASTPAAVRAALAEVDLTPWRRLVPPTVVVTAGAPADVEVHVATGAALVIEVHREDGARQELAVGPAGTGARRRVDGSVLEERRVALPADLPLGWHRLVATAGDRTEDAVLVVAPDRVDLPPGLTRTWGWMVQLYSVRSSASWGIGDYADLAELLRWSAVEQGAGVLLCNPLHAVAPVLPVQASPYYPSTRRFRSPLYLRIEDTPEYAAADERTRARVDELGAAARGTNGSDRIDRDTVWRAKQQALELLAGPSRSPLREAALSAYREREGRGIEDFALFCALAERRGLPWQSWPAGLHRPDAPDVAAARRELAERVDFHVWMQLLCDEQLAAAERVAATAGMAVGVVHDLAVGVDPGGADAWALQDDLAAGVSVGAPPDSFNQQGQDWGLPPWRPDQLPRSGYAPVRDMLRAVLRHAGGIRIDHVMGLFRLWWVPAGASPAEGTYVRYDADAMLGVLALEAHRAGALVVGEDLGTVEPEVRRMLADRGILGSAVLWFEKVERDDDHDDHGGEETPPPPLPPAQWRQLAMASVTTHDLPTAAGFLTDEHVRVRAEIGVLGRPVEQERAAVATERAQLLDLLHAEGLLPRPPGDPAERVDRERMVLALHALLTRTPSRVVLAALGDAVGDLRQPNLPGTTDAYPNWQLPVAAPGADGSARPLLLEDLQRHPGVRRLADTLLDGLRSLPG